MADSLSIAKTAAFAGHRTWGLKLLRIIAKSLLLLQVIVASGAAARNFAQEAAEKFKGKKYDQAIPLYRKHLRRAPKDFNVWNQLGASYYYTGLPRRGLRYLKHVQRKTSEKSYNYYYQGLCYTALENTEKAKEYFAFAATRYTDEYGSRANFEMAAITYNERDKQKTSQWLSTYLSRYPRGVYKVMVQRMVASLREGKWLPKIEGTKKPNLEKALYKYNKLSLSTKPHYWFFQPGFEFVDRAGQEPNPQGGLKSRNLTQMGIQNNMGVGVGPWKEGVVTAYGGYSYRQLWLTDPERLEIYTEDVTDLQYFPFRPDLLERRHQFYGDIRRPVTAQLFLGIFGRYEFARISSRYDFAPEEAELKRVLKISDSQLIIPWVGFSWTLRIRSLFYLYFRKELNEDSPEHSNKSFDFGGSSDKPVVSYGLSSYFEFPEQETDLNLEIFHYEFIFNDYWLDYVRQGAIVSATHQLIPNWFITGAFGIYKDEYILERLKLGTCNLAPTIESKGAQEKTPVPCGRTDDGTLIQAKLVYNFSQFQRFNIDLSIVDNINPDQQEFEESKMTFRFNYTLAFPSVRKVTRYVDRFADTSFTKEAN